MAELRACVVASSTEGAELLLGVLPADATATVLLLDREPEAELLGPAVQAHLAGCDLVVLDSTQRRRDLAGWLSATEDLPLVWAIDAVRRTDTGIDADQVVHGGTHRLVHHVPMGRPLVVLAKPTSSRSIDDAVQVVNLTVDTAASRVSTVSATDERTNGVSLAAARRIISIGRGIGGPERVPLYRELAERLNAALGASRVAVDSGWIPFAHQVGQTGAAVAPDLYVAFGISGASQHLAGMRASKSIVAINTDVEAPLCRLADLVIKADANDVAESLLKKAAESGW